MLMRGLACTTLGMPCSQVRWQVPPITSKSPQPSFEFEGLSAANRAQHEAPRGSQ